MKLKDLLLEIAYESNFLMQRYQDEDQSFESFLDSNPDFFNFSKKILLYLNHYLKFELSGRLIEFNVGYYKVPTQQYDSYYGSSSIDEAIKLTIDYPLDFLKVLKFVFLNKKDLNEYLVSHKIVLNSYFAINTYFGIRTDQMSNQMIEQSKGELYMKYLKKPIVIGLVNINDDLVLGSSITNQTLIQFFKYLVLKDLARDNSYEQGKLEYELLANHTFELLKDLPSLTEEN
jgi:hypothetical protein